MPPSKHMLNFLQLTASLFTVTAGTRQGSQPFNSSIHGDGNSPVKVTVTLPCPGDPATSYLPPSAHTNSTTTTSSLPGLSTLSTAQTEMATTTASLDKLILESLAQTKSATTTARLESLTTESIQLAKPVNTTANLTHLTTWWHATGEINTQTPVQNGNVRQSHLYSIQVATNTISQYYDSFVYETIPRNGNGKICFPGNLTSFCDIEDQISIEPAVNITMAWTQFLYGADAIVKVSRLNGAAVSAAKIIIHPTNLNYTVTSVNGSALISLPYNSNGVQFSVECQDDLWTYRNSGPGENSSYVQDENPAGSGYVSHYTDDMPIVGVEPRNALLIFASPYPSKDLVPNDEPNTLRVKPGLVTGLNLTEKSILYFGPGVYYMTGTAHAILSASVNWVFLAPGAYIKGAIQYTSSALNLKATGFGVLSGEQYVYQANAAEGYQNLKSDLTSVKMWKATSSSSNVTWTLHGLTINAPPFNSMDFYGAVDTFSVYASDYKQVGAFFGQTDGLEMYPNSHVHDVFYHSGDDTIKTYYSNVVAERVIVWKTNNAPVVQFGWYPRNLTNITVDSVDVIHSRYLSQAIPYPRTLVGSSAFYLDPYSTSTANTTSSVSQYTISNWRSEGISPALLGINPLANIDTFTVSNVWIEQLAPNTTGVGLSTLRVFTDAENDNRSVQLGQASPGGLGLAIKDFYVGGTHVTQEAGNWGSTSVGRLDIDAAYSGRWTIV